MIVVLMPGSHRLGPHHQGVAMCSTSCSDIAVQPVGQLSVLAAEQCDCSQCCTLLPPGGGTPTNQCEPGGSRWRMYSFI